MLLAMTDESKVILSNGIQLLGIGPRITIGPVRHHMTNVIEHACVTSWRLCPATHCVTPGQCFLKQRLASRVPFLDLTWISDFRQYNCILYNIMKMTIRTVRQIQQQICKNNHCKSPELRHLECQPWKASACSDWYPSPGLPDPSLQSQCQSKTRSLTQHAGAKMPQRPNVTSLIDSIDNRLFKKQVCV